MSREMRSTLNPVVKTEDSCLLCRLNEMQREMKRGKKKGLHLTIYDPDTKYAFYETKTHLLWSN